MTLAVSATEETKASMVITDPPETSPAFPTWLCESLSALSHPGPYQSLGTALAATPVLGSCTRAKHQPRPPCLMPTAVRALKASLCSCGLTHYQPDTLPWPPLPCAPQGRCCVATKEHADSPGSYQHSHSCPCLLCLPQPPTISMCLQLDPATIQDLQLCPAVERVDPAGSGRYRCLPWCLLKAQLRTPTALLECPSVLTKDYAVVKAVDPNDVSQ